MGPPGGCLDSWECPGIGPNAGLFQVVCTGKDASGWTGCQCVHNGTVERALEEPQTVWCHVGTPDGFERLIDANRECGWALDTSAI
jgi:hypothetical protein